MAGLIVAVMLVPTALAISFVGYMESIAVANALASKRRQWVDANQELMALGVANFGAALGGGYPVTGGFSRSVVNYEAGANSGLASIITAILILLTILFLTPRFYFLPQAVLAAIVVVAVAGLVDVDALRHVWRYNKVDSKPYVAIVGRLGDSETYRNVLRHDVQCWPDVVAVRVDESLYFANTRFLEDLVLTTIADRPEFEHFVLIGTVVNFIDASALETLKSLQRELRDAGVTLHLAAIKGPVLDRLRRERKLSE